MFSSVLILLITITLPSYAQTTPPCIHYKFAQTLNKPNGYKQCIDLPYYNSTLHYNYNPSIETLEIAYRHPGMKPGTLSKWVAWAINPTAKGMVGAQCLVAYHSHKDNSVVVYTSPITSYETTLAKGVLSFNVTGLEAAIVDDEVIVFATIKVPNNRRVIHQLWQQGHFDNAWNPIAHPFENNILSMGSLNLVSGVLTLPPQVPPWKYVSPFFGLQYPIQPNSAKLC